MTENKINAREKKLISRPDPHNRYIFVVRKAGVFFIAVTRNQVPGNLVVSGGVYRGRNLKIKRIRDGSKKRKRNDYGNDFSVIFHLCYYTGILTYELAYYKAARQSAN